MTETQTIRKRRGRGARERILAAAKRLFVAQGINATGMDQVADEAQVSKRTVYDQFGSKDELIREYLAEMERGNSPENELLRTDLPPRERLLAIFRPSTNAEEIARGCPYQNAAVEIPDPAHPAHEFARAHKETFARQLSEVAREAGAADPESLGEQLALLFDGATARAVTMNSTAHVDQARAAAAILIGAAVDSGGRRP